MMEVLSVMHWPSQSLELHIIEAVWNYLGRKWNKKQSMSKDDLWNVLQIYRKDKTG